MTTWYKIEGYIPAANGGKPFWTQLLDLSGHMTHYDTLRKAQAEFGIARSTGTERCRLVQVTEEVLETFEPVCTCSGAVQRKCPVHES